MQTLAGIRNSEFGMRNTDAARRLQSATQVARVARSRRGFTLVELMIVVVVIAILMGLLLPALQNVRIKAKEAAVIVEIKQLEAAIMAFRAKYGVEPPSRVSIYLTQAGWTGDPTSQAAIRRIWPQFDFTMGGASGAGTAYPSYWSGTINLNSGECLLFFLGGVMPAAGQNQVPTGFAKNPQYPFAPVSAASNREGPFFEFNDVSRIKDVDTSGMNEWYDSLPDQSKPYLYFSSYEGRGYSLNELPSPSTTSTTYTYLHDFYRVSSTAATPPSSRSLDASNNVTASGSQLLAPQKAQSFQIISPGYDQDYGSGGVFNPKLPNSGLVDSNGKPELAAYDNLTNFNGGRLNP